jgi:hypothetical protein
MVHVDKVSFFNVTAINVNLSKLRECYINTAGDICSGRKSNNVWLRREMINHDRAATKKAEARRNETELFPWVAAGLFKFGRACFKTGRLLCGWALCTFIWDTH